MTNEDTPTPTPAATNEQITRLIAHLEKQIPVTANIEAVLQRIMLDMSVLRRDVDALETISQRLTTVDATVNTYVSTWRETLDARKHQMDTLIKRQDDISQQIKAIEAWRVNSDTMEDDRESRFRLMQRDLYGFGESDQTRILGLMGRQQRGEMILNDFITKQNDMNTIIRERFRLEDEARARARAWRMNAAKVIVIVFEKPALRAGLSILGAGSVALITAFAGQDLIEFLQQLLGTQ